VETWHKWLPELVTGGLTIAITVIGRALGLRPIARIRAIKNAAFDLGAILIDYETCEAENRALREALDRRRAIEDLRDHESSAGSRSGATTAPADPSPTPAKRRRPTRLSSRPSDRTKPAPSPTDPTRP
jgi:hypothetical protein